VPDGLDADIVNISDQKKNFKQDILTKHNEKVYYLFS
jgi:hypothetical protein